jgi:excisionase family DNA binding protein
MSIDRILGPELVSALETYISERVEEALASHVTVTNGASPWLSVADAAGYLGVSERSVGRLLDRGRIRSSYIGRRRLLHRDDLDAYLRGGAA